MIISRLASFLAIASLPVSALAAGTQPIEPIEIPPSLQQGVDMIYIDPEIAPAVRKREALLQDIGIQDFTGPVDLFLPLNPLHTSLRRGLVRYRADWGGLPQTLVPSGPALKAGARGERVALLRERLGLPAGDGFDEAVAKAVRSYQQVHGLKADGVAGETTIASLNLGFSHYEQLMRINMERARRLPGSDEPGRYILVDAGAARLYMFEDGKIKDSMKVIVGKPASVTPMMAASLRFASINPYWNVPTDLVETLIAPKVLSEGLSHIEAERYEILSDWTDDAEVVDPASIDWAAVADGNLEIRVRQLPGRGNSMGDIKFMMPNDFGIYLHDTPDKALFQREDRWLSNGCVRVEDARRLAKWLFGDMPKGSDRNVEEDVELDSPVPVYITYLTAGSSSEGLAFRKDPYKRDQALLAQRFGSSEDAVLAMD